MVVTKIVYPEVERDGTIRGKEGRVSPSPFVDITHDHSSSRISIGTGIRPDGSVEIMSVVLSHDQTRQWSRADGPVIGGNYQEVEP